MTETNPKAMRMLPRLILLCAALACGVVLAELLPDTERPDTSQVPRMTVEALAKRLGDPDVRVLDVRRKRDWKYSSRMISGAMRAAPDRFSEWSAALPKGGIIVLYCT